MRPHSAEVPARRGGGSRGARVGVASLCVYALTSCVSPAINADGYHDKVTHSAQKMVGVIGSAQEATELYLQDRMLWTVTDDLVSNAEQDAQSVVTSLDSVQPPDKASIALRDAADQVLQDASSQLSGLRIAERRRDRAQLRSTLDDLAQTLDKVQKLQAR